MKLEIFKSKLEPLIRQVALRYLEEVQKAGGSEEDAIRGFAYIAEEEILKHY